MSMMFCLRALTADQARDFERSETFRMRVVGHVWESEADRDAFLAGLGPSMPADIVASYRARPIGPDGPELGPIVSLEKAWHGVHFLLTGEAWGGREPEALAIFGGDEIGDDCGYGPPRLLAPARVREVAAALGDLEPDDLRARFDADRLEDAEIYPGGGWSEPGTLDWLLDGYRLLRTAYDDAASDDEALVLWMT